MKNSKKKRIGIDARALVGEKTGIGHYLWNVLEQFNQIDEQNEYYLYSHKPVQNTLPGLFRLRSGQTHQSHFWLQTQLPFWLHNDKIDLFWGGGYAAPLIGHFLNGWKTVITVHDLVYQFYPQTLPLKLATHMRMGLPAYMTVSDRIMVVSNNTANDVVKCYKQFRDKVVVTPLAAHVRFYARLSQTAIQDRLARYNLKQGYLLYIGTIEPRKGLDTIFYAMAQIKASEQVSPLLVVAGKLGWKFSELVSMPAKLGITEHVRFLDYVPDEDLPILLQGAKIFVYPSYYEGFGLPVLEAMASGAPVITSRVSSLPEVAGDAAIYVDPGNSSQLAHAIVDCIRFENLRIEMRQKGWVQARRFSWHKTAEKTLSVFEECMK